MPCVMSTGWRGTPSITHNKRSPPLSTLTASLMISGNCVELLEAFGTVPIYPEVNALQLAIRHQSLEPILAPEEMGYAPDNCARPRLIVLKLAEWRRPPHDFCHGDEGGVRARGRTTGRSDGMRLSRQSSLRGGDYPASMAVFAALRADSGTDKNKLKVLHSPRVPVVK
jgi:hypothetical protein